jgi:hypothetical protein
MHRLSLSAQAQLVKDNIGTLQFIPFSSPFTCCDSASTRPWGGGSDLAQRLRSSALWGRRRDCAGRRREDGAAARRRCGSVGRRGCEEAGRLHRAARRCDLHYIKPEAFTSARELTHEEVVHCIYRVSCACRDPDGLLH